MFGFNVARPIFRLTVREGAAGHRFIGGSADG